MEYKQPSIVSGLKLQDILDMDVQTFNKLTLKQLRQVTGRLVSAGNKRIRTFEKAKESSPAIGRLIPDIDIVDTLSEGIDRPSAPVLFSTKGKNLNQLRAEFKRAKSFLEDKTSILKNWRKTKMKTIAKLASQEQIKLSPEAFDKFWKSYEKLKELKPSVEWIKLKYTTLKDINDYMIENEEATPEEIASEIEKRISAIYEEAEEEESEDYGVSDFFDIE